jgi:hypothetical protein
VRRDIDPGDEYIARRIAIKAARAKEWEYRPRDASRPVLVGIKHGTEYGYQSGCGCDPCREARRVSQAAWRARRRLRVAA